MNALALSQSRKMMLYVAIGLGAGFLILLVLLIIVWLRGRARHNQLMMKVQEITSIRPMREVQGAPTGMLESSRDSESTDFDIFAPQTPKTKPTPKPKPRTKKDEDSLGGLADTKDLGPEMPVNDLSAMENAFGGMGLDEDAPTVKAAGDSMNFDDIFGGNGSDTPGGQSPESVSLTADETEEDPFSRIGQEPPVREKMAEPTQPAPLATPPEPKTTAPRRPEPPTVQTGPMPGDEMVWAPEETQPAPLPGNGGAISFDDILSVGDNEEKDTPGHQAKTSPEDLLSLFDNVVGPDETGPVSTGPSLDHLKDSPFANMLGGDEPGPGARPAEDVDETEIPLIDLGGGKRPVDSTVRNETTRISEDLPSFSLDDISALDDEPATRESHPLPELEGGAAVEINFHDDTVGQKPAGWEGDYDYAVLTVEDENPPAGGGKYVCFRKPEGGGKAFYACRFPEIHGKCAIEFDLCCQEKNKFLLGFYVDLDEGIINGYIDSTHVAHDLSLVQNPGSLNTFSIRDNINTTGVLMLANLKVYRIQ